MPDFDAPAERPRSYTVADYATRTTDFINDDNRNAGTSKFDYPGHQRYSLFNINMGRHSYEGDSINLRNVVTTAVIKSNVEILPSEQTEQRGGLYFEHGFDKFTPKDIVAAPGRENVDMDQIASTLINNKSFELKMTAHADTSGDAAKNQTLSENRLSTAKTLLLAALQRQGLSEQEAKDIYDKRVAPHASVIAFGETNGPVSTGDNIKEQGNRVVTFDLITNTGPRQNVTLDVSKGKDFDNHEHTVVVNLGTSNKLKELHFYPEDDSGVQQGQFAIADENTNFILKIDPNRRQPMTINYYAHSNRVADNTDFLIESDKPGAVTSKYNTQTGNIDVSVEGKPAVSIMLLRGIDPAAVRIGQISSTGQATISPLTNLAEVAPLSESRQSGGERNILTSAADSVVQLSIAAKHLYLEHPNDPEGYRKALADMNFAGKLDDAFKDLEKAGIKTGPYKTLVMNSYANPDSASYNPAQVVFPFQTFQGLYESEVRSGVIKDHDRADAYKELMILLNAPKTGASPAPTKTSAPAPLQNP